MEGSIRVLHVDDEPDFADLAAAFLERQDDRFTVETVSGATEALDRLDEEPFDCVISDYEMPETDGIEFLEAVREVYPDLPFVLFTGKGSEAVASEAISAEVTDYLQKGSGSERYELLANRVTNAVEQHRAERAAERAKRRMRELAENTDDVLFLFTADWEELLFINSAVEDVFGVEPDRVREQPERFFESIHPDDRAGVVRTMERIRSGETVNNEHRVRIDGGDEKWVWVHGNPVFDVDGDVVRAAGFARDVTERKYREEQLERQNRQLEEFTDLVSHDLQTPLNVARGRIDLARSEADSEHLEQAETALARMETMIEDLLSLAREGESTAAVGSTPLEEVIAASWENVAPDEATLVDETEGVVRADRGRLQQLLENLFRNAVEHGSTSPASQARQDAVEHGGPDVTVRVGDLEDGFYVEDDGPGVPESERERVFEGGYSTADEGTGFGLRIVDRICEAHGWEVAVTDGEEGGARFEVTGVDELDAREFDS